MENRRSAFGKRGRKAESRRPVSGLERAKKAPFSKIDILAHARGETIHNDLNNMAVRGMVRELHEIEDGLGSNDKAKLANADAGRVDSLVGEINRILKRD